MHVQASSIGISIALAWKLPLPNGDPNTMLTTYFKSPKTLSIDKRGA